MRCGTCQLPRPGSLVAKILWPMLPCGSPGPIGIEPTGWEPPQEFAGMGPEAAESPSDGLGWRDRRSSGMDRNGPGETGCGFFHPPCEGSRSAGGPRQPKSPAGGCFGCFPARFDQTRIERYPTQGRVERLPPSNSVPRETPAASVGPQRPQARQSGPWSTESVLGARHCRAKALNSRGGSANSSYRAAGAGWSRMAPAGRHGIRLRRVLSARRRPRRFFPNPKNFAPWAAGRSECKQPPTSPAIGGGG